jgi:MATE family multidrug resistance protein
MIFTPVDRALYGRIWKIALPMMLAGVSEPLLGAVDTAVVGHLPEPEHLGAVAVGAMLFSYVFWAFGFLKMGTGGYIAQAFGREDGTELRAVIGRACLIALVISILLILLQRPILAFSLPLIGAEQGVNDLTDTYFSIRIWSTPAALAQYIVFGILLGLQNARANLVVVLFLNITNILLDLLFVLVFDMGVAGVAWATLIASYLAAALGIWLVIRELRTQPGVWTRDGLLDLARHRELLSTNFNIFIRTLLLVSCWSLFTAIGARINTEVLAANAVLANFMAIMAYALDGFAHAAQAVSGAAYGARNRKLFEESVRAALQWAFLFGIPIAFAYLFLGHYLVDVMTGIPEVRELAYGYLPWMAILSFVSTWAFVYDGVFMGATKTRPLRDSIILCSAVYTVTILTGSHFYGAAAIWPSVILLNMLRGLTLHLAYPKLLESLDDGKPVPPAAT